MASSDLEARFKKAVWLIRNGPKMQSTNEQKLLFYSYFKQVCQCVDFQSWTDGLFQLRLTRVRVVDRQATLGDVQGPQPWLVNLEARAKWDAWAKLKGMSKEEAMQGYIDLMGDPEVWEHHETLKTYEPASFTT